MTFPLCFGFVLAAIQYIATLILSPLERARLAVATFAAMCCADCHQLVLLNHRLPSTVEPNWVVSDSSPALTWRKQCLTLTNEPKNRTKTEQESVHLWSLEASAVPATTGGWYS